MRPVVVERIAYKAMTRLHGGDVVAVATDWTRREAVSLHRDSGGAAVRFEAHFERCVASWGRIGSEAAVLITWLTRLIVAIERRRELRGRRNELGELIDESAALLDRTPEPAVRAAVLERLAEQLPQYARVVADADTPRARRAAAAIVLDARIAVAIAEVERARAVGGSRVRRGWTELEGVGGELLDQLADGRLDERGRAELYRRLRVAIGQVALVSAGLGLLERIERWHDANAARDGLD